jgi:hypothetical protein
MRTTKFSICDLRFTNRVGVESRGEIRRSKIVNGTTRWKIVVARGWFLLNLMIFVGLGLARAQTVIPFVDEIIINPQTHLGTAYFGYDNTNGRTFNIHIGAPDNYFDPQPEDRGQVERFLPGTHHYAFASIFDYTEEPVLHWALSGNSVVVDSASAGANTPQTSAFSYQGQLTDGNTAANGLYQMRFSLFDTEVNGTQIGSSVEMTNVVVTNGLFAVELDFGSTPFVGGASRFLQIEVGASGTNTYTALAPRQRITTTPYATRAFSAATSDTATTAQQLNGTSGDLFVQTSDPRLSDSRPPTAGSANYIQNGATQQANSSFNISGDAVIGGSLTVNGDVTAAAFNTSSDRNLKTNFTPVNARDVLDKVVGLPLAKWNFKEDPGVPHLGPMAQDFYAAFGVGSDEKHIATVDADGVALAAIQGLNQKLTAELKQRTAENAELRSRLDRLEKMILNSTENK